MSELVRAKLSPAVTLSSHGDLLQRKCACGTHTVAGGKCDSCLQKKSEGHAQARGVPPVVGEVLNSAGRPLDAGTRTLMESRFGHDFSRVRVHAAARAAESAEAGGAAAYTVGRDISFGPGRYAPGTAEGRRLLAHELTHVLQQTASRGGGASEEQAEREADDNSLSVTAGRAGRALSAAPVGLIQREEKKPTVEGSAERTGAEGTKEKPEVKDQFTFKADVTVPLSGVSLGAVSFLDDIKLSPSYTTSGPLLGVFPATSEEYKLQIALMLAKLEISNLKKKEDALRKGKLSLGVTLSTSGTSQLPFDPSKPLTSLGAALSLKAGATTPTLLPSRLGTLTLGTSLSAGGSLTHKPGDESATPPVESKTTPKAEGKVGAAVDYKSPSTRNPYLTMGGLLGDTAQVTAGLEGSTSGSITPDERSGTLSGGVSLGITGKRKGYELVLKGQITGTITVNQKDTKTGTVETRTNGAFFGLSTGVNF